MNELILITVFSGIFPHPSLFLIEGQNSLLKKHLYKHRFFYKITPETNLNQATLSYTFSRRPASRNVGGTDAVSRQSRLASDSHVAVMRRREKYGF